MLILIDAIITFGIIFCALMSLTCLVAATE